MPPKKKTKSKVPEPEPDYEEEEPLVLPAPSTEDDPEDDNITRCVCGSQDEEAGLMIQCETCGVWQHGICVGFTSVDDVPEKYYCEQCRPDQHAMLHKSIGRKPTGGQQRPASSNVMPPPSHDGPPTHKLTASNLHASNTAAAAAAALSTSLSHSSSRSPSPPTKLSMPKRRNTLNSREAAYEEALERGDLAALEKITAGEDDDESVALGKRKRKRSGGTTAGDETSSVKRKRSSPTPGSVTSEKPNLNDFDSSIKDMNDGTGSATGSVKADTAPARRVGKRSTKKEKEPSLDAEDANSLAPPSQSGHGNKKHANQYTYRGKSQVSATASPSKPPVSGAVSRATGSIAPDHQPTPTPTTTNRKAAHTTSSSTNINKASNFAPTSPLQPINNSWGLPDHLSHLSDLLPTPLQGPIDVAIGRDEVVQERGAKVKWPLKRTTVGEMRRRVRAMLDFCTKAQVDVAERTKRAAALEAFLLKASESGLEGAGSGKGKNRNDAAIDCDLVASIMALPEVADPSSSAPSSSPPPAKMNGSTAMDVSSMSTAELLSSLTSDLLNFQEKFGAGPGGKVYRETAPRERRPRGAAAAAMAAIERSD